MRPPWVGRPTITVILGLAGLTGCQETLLPLAEVPFDAPKHQIVVQVMLEEQGPFNMLIDTGTDPSAIDAALARRLRPPADTTLHTGEGVGGSPIRAFLWDMRELRLGDLAVHRVAAAAIDLSPLGKRLGTRLDGVLGYSFFAGRVVQIDYPRRRVRFFRSAPPPTHRQVAEFPLRLDPDDSTPQIQGRVNGRPARLLYDSGSGGSVAISGEAVRALGLEAAFAAARPDSAFGYGGRAETREGTVPSVEIGPLLTTTCPATLACATSAR
jgi:predicted aspartyl protease